MKRTALVQEKLEESMCLLQKVMDACNECLKTDASWNQACRTRGLEPLKARQVVLRIHKCAGVVPQLVDIGLDDMYDGYEKFYRAVFGSNIFKDAAAPYDYKESALHVIKDTGLTDRESLVLMQHFGLGEHEPPKTLEAVAASLGINRSWASQIEANALRKCRYKKRLDVLKMGLAKYTQLDRQAREYTEQELAQSRMEHEALMAKQDSEHKKRMAAIRDCPYEDAVVKLLPDDIKEKLDRTPIDVLSLTVRARNVLKRRDVKSLLNLLKLGGPDGLNNLVKLRNMSYETAKGTLKALDAYIQNEYGMTADRLRLACFVGKEGET